MRQLTCTVCQQSYRSGYRGRAGGAKCRRCRNSSKLAAEGAHVLASTLMSSLMKDAEFEATVTRRHQMIEETAREWSKAERIYARKKSHVWLRLPDGTDLSFVRKVRKGDAMYEQLSIDGQERILTVRDIKFALRAGHGFSVAALTIFSGPPIIDRQLVDVPDITIRVSSIDGSSLEVAVAPQGLVRDLKLAIGQLCSEDPFSVDLFVEGTEDALPDAATLSSVGIGNGNEAGLFMLPREASRQGQLLDKQTLPDFRDLCLVVNEDAGAAPGSRGQYYAPIDQWTPPGSTPWTGGRAKCKALVGCRLRVRWTDGHFECVVKSYDAGCGTHHCVYDDGDARDYRMASKAFEVIPSLSNQNWTAQANDNDDEDDDGDDDGGLSAYTDDGDDDDDDDDACGDY